MIDYEYRPTKYVYTYKHKMNLIKLGCALGSRDDYKLKLKRYPVSGNKRKSAFNLITNSIREQLTNNTHQNTKNTCKNYKNNGRNTWRKKIKNANKRVRKQKKYWPA